MALVLLYLVVLVLVALVLFGAATLLFGRGEQLPPLPRATTATVLPAYGVTGADVDAVKFTQVLRGYKTREVDWVLDRLGRELEVLRGQVAALQSSGTEARADPAGVTDTDADADADAGTDTDTETDADTDTDAGTDAVESDRSGPT